MLTLIHWERNEALIPADPEERMKINMTYLEKVKQSVDSGDLKIWGIALGGGTGFAITEGDAKKIFEMNARWVPYVRFEVEPMLSVDEAIAVLKDMQK